MKAKLVKTAKLYALKTDDIIATNDDYFSTKLEHPYRLSTKNCEAIVNGYDLDELAYKFNPVQKLDNESIRNGFKAGFQKALEILGDKKFTFDQMLLLAGYVVGLTIRSKSDPSLDIKQETLDFIDKMEQTEWEVEVLEEEPLVAKERQIHGEHVAFKLIKSTVFPNPLFDADGCLILKLK